MKKNDFFLKIKKGFTLLEMLVVLGIIAIIVTMGFVSYSTAQKKARDAKRKQDLKSIQNAMEQYYSICGYQYPTSISSGIICSSITPTVAIMPTLPKDPKTASPYPTQTLTSDSYRICAQTETEPTPCVSNQQ